MATQWEHKEYVLGRVYLKKLMEEFGGKSGMSFCDSSVNTFSQQLSLLSLFRKGNCRSALDLRAQLIC